ncbi:GNAT family N-acetyltransferase [Bacteroides xylanolyticus]|uniref:GNAT family N-acetyltransferase n=2 Tax=Lacrimispora TaxID=2719231 RepID=A0ABX1VW71_9FIRM|nr:GNAT family N-acetyltransferase [Lacrimispora defluvii]
MRSLQIIQSLRLITANEIEILNLEVRKDNINAIHLYEKFGFKSIGISPAFFKIDGEYVDFELMYLDLRPLNSDF